MLDLIIEGLGSALLPCSLVLLIPGLAVTVGAGRDRYIAAIAFLVGATLYTWLVASERGGQIPDTSAGIIFAVASLASTPRPSSRRLPKLSLAAGLLTGVAAAGIWVPCTGEALADLQEGLPDRSFDGILDQGLYIFCVLSPIVLTLLGLNALKKRTLAKFLKPAGYIAAGLLMIFALLVITDMHNDIISQLISWSV